MPEPNEKLIMQGGMMLPQSLVRSNTPMFPVNNQEKTQVNKPKFSGVRALSKRMSTAFDRLTGKMDPEKGLQKSDTKALGSLLLELEIVNNNLKSIAEEVRLSGRKKQELADKEEEILKEEEKKVTGLAASFRDFRRKFGAFAAIISGKAFLEGDTGKGFENAGIAVTAFLPEIIKVVSTVVMARLLLSGRGGVAARGMSGGRASLLPQLLLGGGLLGAGAALGSGGDSEQRRFELQKRESLPNILTRNDVRRFRNTTKRFDNILINTLNKKLPNQRQILQETEEEIESPPGPKELINNLFNRKESDDSLDFEENDEVKNGTELDIDNLSGVELQTLKILQEMKDSEEFKKEIELLKKTDPETAEDVLRILNLLSDSAEDNDQAFVPDFSSGVAPGTSDIFINPEYASNSKIAFILEYDGSTLLS